MAKTARKKEEDLDSYRHETETRRNVFPVLGGFGKWTFTSIIDLWNAKGEIRKFAESDTLV